MMIMTVFDKKDKRIIARHLIVMNFNICNNINQVINDTGVFESYMTSDFRALPDIIDLYGEGIDEYRLFREYCSEAYYELLERIQSSKIDDKPLKDSVVKYIQRCWRNTWRDIVRDERLTFLFAKIE